MVDLTSLAGFKSSALRNYTNMRGWKTHRKLLVIESDDWGAIGMPGPDAYRRLLDSGIRVDRSLYDRLDCLENRDDLQVLMNVIDTYRDANDRPAIFTVNTVMGNPDFEAIEHDHFQRFHHQHFLESYRHYHGEDLEADWRQAIQAGLIRPQFHAREHLNSPLWMTDLRAGHQQARLAFNHRFYGLRTKTSSQWQQHYKAAYCAESIEQMNCILDIVTDGLQLFENTFHFRSKTFVACNYVLPVELEEHLADQGVKLVQTQRGYVEVMPKHAGQRRLRYRRTGQLNAFMQRYCVWNVLFEPYLDKSVDWADHALRQIKQAFFFGTPAIICSHRINYTSGMDRQHRDASMRQLERLLSQILRRWPEVEFITSDELVTRMVGCDS